MQKTLLLFLSLLSATAASAQLSGTYIINSDASQNPDFTSLSAAASALSAGVSGQVVFEVAPGTYEEYVTLNNISGTSETNRVIFRGMGADNQQVVVTSNAGYTTNVTLTLDGPDYVTFENMTLASTSENRARVAVLRGGLTNDRFQNVRFVGCLSDASNTDNDKNLVERISGGWMDTDNAFVDCEFVNGFIGLYYQGQSMAQYNDGLLVENCTFTNQCSKSIYATFTDHLTLRGNIIDNDNDTHTDYIAIDVFRCRYNCLIENNVMTVNHPTKYATVMKIRPCTGSAAEPIIIRNNIVNLQTGATSNWCYSFDNADCDYIYFAHNTAKCSGSGSGGNLFVQKDWEHFYAYNNLFVNETSGYVFRFNNASANRFCDYNRVSFVGNNVGIYAGTDCAALSDWTTATGFDTHSATCTPEFVGNNDLHITSANGLTVAHPLDYVTTDIDGEERSNTPCAGADEYESGANLPPVVVNPISNIVFETFPDSQTVDLTNTFDDPDDPNENIVITVASNSNPSLVGTTLNNRTLQVQRLLATGGLATVILQATSNGQSVQTSFTVECVAEDLPPVVVSPLAPINFNNYPQSFSFDISECFNDPDNNNWMMEYSVQTCPSEISASIDENDMLQMSRTTPNAFTNKVLVIRATSNGKYADMNVSVSGVEVAVNVDIAHFEDVEVGSNGYWQPQEGNNEMLSGGWVFTNYYSEYFWGGFTTSNHTDLNQTGLGAQYTAVTGVGYDGSSQYAVAYTYGAQTEVYAADGESHTVTGCYVTNNLWAYQNMLEGDYSVTPFGGTNGTDPDWFKLTATGKNANGQTVGTLDFYLADYRFSNPEDDYIIDTWEWFDLSPLGEVASISFGLESTKQNYGGMITPAYFCMDDFNGGASVDLPPYVVNPVQDVVFNTFPQTLQVNLEGVVTDPDDPDENIAYSIVSNSNTNALTATMDGRILVLTRQNHNQATANVVMRATSDGQSVDFNVHVVMNAATDLPPYVLNPVDDVVFEQYPQTIHVDLDGVVTDPDDPDESIVYSVLSNSNTTALVAQVNGTDMILGRLTGDEATADLVMRATSNGQHVDFNVHVIMIRVTDQSPYVVNPIPDVIMDEFPKMVQIDLNSVVTDDDDPDELIEYSLLSNSNEAYLSATLGNKILILNRLQNEEDEITLVIRATSNGLYVDFEVHVVLVIVEGVEEAQAYVSAYPNPTQSQLALSVAGANGFEYVVYNVVGQEVIRGTAHGQETHLSLGNQPKGMYVITIFSEGNRLMQKVMVY